MAKNKSKDTGSIIWPVATLLLGGLILGLLALPFMSIEILGSSTSVSGWEFIDFSDGAPTGCAVVLLLLVIFACLMMLLSVVKLLNCMGIIKDSKFINFLLVICGLAVAVLAIVNIFTISSYASGDSLNTGWGALDDVISSLIGSVVSIGWTGLIINGVVGVLAFISSALAIKEK